MAAIDIENLSKSYGGAHVLRDLNLHIEQGEIYGLLGASGAGKTTLMNLLVGFLKPQSGIIRVLGRTDLARNIGLVGYLPDALRLPPTISGQAYMRTLGKIDGLRDPQLALRIHEELSSAGLLGAGQQPIGTYAPALRQRFGVAQALLGQPPLLLLDEPAAGLAAEDRRELYGYLRGLRERGCTILMASHHPEDLATLCDRVGILHLGRIAAEAAMAALGTLSPSVKIAVGELAEITAERLARLSSAVQIGHGQITIDPNSQQLQGRALKILVDAQVEIYALEPQVSPLAALFQHVISGELVDAAFTPRADLALAEEAEEAPPNSLFAPPGHPDAQGADSPESLPATDQGSPTAHEGETVLQELPQSGEEHHELR